MAEAKRIKTIYETEILPVTLHKDMQSEILFHISPRIIRYYKSVCKTWCKIITEKLEISRNHIDMVQYCLENGHISILKELNLPWSSQNYRYTVRPIEMACHHGMETVNWVLGVLQSVNAGVIVVGLEEYQIACFRGNVDVLDWLYSLVPPEAVNDQQYLFNRAAQNAQGGVIRWLVNHGFKVEDPDQFYCFSLGSGDLEYVKTLQLGSYSDTWPWSGLLNPLLTELYVSASVTGGSVIMLEWLESKLKFKMELDSEIYMSAVTDRQSINMLECLLSRGVKLPQSVNYGAILSRGFLDAAKWFHAKGVLNNCENVYSSVVSYCKDNVMKTVEMLKWVHSTLKPILHPTASLMGECVKSGNVFICEWAYSVGATWNFVELREKLNKTKNPNLITWFQQHKSP